MAAALDKIWLFPLIPVFGNSRFDGVMHLFHRNGFHRSTEVPDHHAVEELSSVCSMLLLSGGNDMTRKLQRRRKICNDAAVIGGIGPIGHNDIRPLLHNFPVEAGRLSRLIPAEGKWQQILPLDPDLIVRIIPRKADDRRRSKRMLQHLDFLKLRHDFILSALCCFRLIPQQPSRHSCGMHPDPEWSDPLRTVRRNDAEPFRWCRIQFLHPWQRKHCSHK